MPNPQPKTARMHLIFFWIIFAIFVLFALWYFIWPIIQQHMRSQSNQSLSTYGSQSNTTEHLDSDLDIDVDYLEGTPDIQNGMMLIVAHVTITNSSSNTKSIQANMRWGIRSPGNKNVDNEQNIFIASWEPPENTVLDFKTMIEKENDRSFGDYLKFPLRLEPQGLASGFMLFCMPLQAYVDFNKLLPTTPTTLPDSKLYLEWTDRLTKEDFREIITDIYPLGSSEGFRLFKISKPIILKGNGSYVVPLR